MARRIQKGQMEVAGTESPGRIPELHALVIEINDLTERRMALQKEENEKRAEAAAELHKRGMTEYECDGMSLWIEPGKEKVKARVERLDDGEGGDADEEG